jgi:hypothetical protein
MGYRQRDLRATVEWLNRAAEHQAVSVQRGRLILLAAELQLQAKTRRSSYKIGARNATAWRATSNRR